MLKIQLCITGTNYIKLYFANLYTSTVCFIYFLILFFTDHMITIYIQLKSVYIQNVQNVDYFTK